MTRPGTAVLHRRQPRPPRLREAPVSAVLAQHLGATTRWQQAVGAGHRSDEEPRRTPPRLRFGCRALKGHPLPERRASVHSPTRGVPLWPYPRTRRSPNRQPAPIRLLRLVRPGWSRRHCVSRATGRKGCPSTLPPGRWGRHFGATRRHVVRRRVIGYPNGMPREALAAVRLRKLGNPHGEAWTHGGPECERSIRKWSDDDVEDRQNETCCAGDGGWPSGLADAGGESKPPQAAPVKSRGGERCGKRPAGSGSGVRREDERV